MLRVPRCAPSVQQMAVLSIVSDTLSGRQAPRACIVMAAAVCECEGWGSTTRPVVARRSASLRLVPPRVHRKHLSPFVRRAPHQRTDVRNFRPTSGFRVASSNPHRTTSCRAVATSRWVSALRCVLQSPSASWRPGLVACLAAWPRREHWQSESAQRIDDALLCTGEWERALGFGANRQHLVQTLLQTSRWDAALACFAWQRHRGGGLADNVGRQLCSAVVQAAPWAVSLRCLHSLLRDGVCIAREDVLGAVRLYTAPQSRNWAAALAVLRPVVPELGLAALFTSIAAAQRREKHETQWSVALSGLCHPVSGPAVHQHAVLLCQHGQWALALRAAPTAQVAHLVALAAKQFFRSQGTAVPHPVAAAIDATRVRPPSARDRRKAKTHR